MQLQADFRKRVFHFNFDARTSRGKMHDKTSWFIRVWKAGEPEVYGIGECGPLPGLSPDDRPDFEAILTECLSRLTSAQLDHTTIARIVPPGFPSLHFGIETALLDLRHGGRRIIFENGFIQGDPIPINGLVWMGDMDLMLQQVADRIAKGFTCLKLKVGSLNFEKECDILKYIRSKYYRENITIRLDANGAFKTDEALYKLNELARFNVHSIEQPVKPGLDEMVELCARSPIPIALDEELIGVEVPDDKRKLLDRIKPQYIILKPTLHGGFQSCRDWISLAESAGVGWWITSALESNIGLNAICQFTAGYPVTIQQGLGTGQLYDDNVESPLIVSQGQILYDNTRSWKVDLFVST